MPGTCSALCHMWAPPPTMRCRRGPAWVPGGALHDATPRPRGQGQPGHISGPRLGSGWESSCAHPTGRTLGVGSARGCGSGRDHPTPALQCGLQGPLSCCVWSSSQTSLSAPTPEESGIHPGRWVPRSPISAEMGPQWRLAAGLEAGVDLRSFHCRSEAGLGWVLLGASGGEPGEGVGWGQGSPPPPRSGVSGCSWGPAGVSLGRGWARGQPYSPRPWVSGSLGGQQEGTLGRWSGAGVSCDAGSLGRVQSVLHPQRKVEGRTWAQLLGSHIL